MNPKVDAFLGKTKAWRNEFERLRKIILGCGLTEELKWGCPCYTAEGDNIVLIHGFKEYCAILFPQGALLKDPHGILIRQTENVQAGRQRGYLLYFSAAKQSATRTARIEKSAPRIFEGKGPND